MEGIFSDIVGIALFYGLEIVAVLILIGSALFPRLLVIVIICGVVAAGFMAVEFVIWWVLANMNGAEPGSGTILKVLSAISIMSLAVYFPLAITRCKAPRRKRMSADDASPSPLP
jgi:hypothetical protein